MKKIFLFLFILTALEYLSAQTVSPRVDIPLNISDGIDSWVLNVGVDSTATNGIDPHLGEAPLPPIPPTDMFYCALDLYPYGVQALVWKDYRNAPSFPYTGSHQHRLKWQLSSNSNEFLISYNLPIGITMEVKDLFGGVLFNSGTLSGEGTYSVPYIELGSANVTMYYNNVGGDPAGPIWGISATSLNFSPVPVGSTDTLQLTIFNYGLSNPLNISSVEFTNSNFTIPPDSFPIFIAPQSSLDFYVICTAASISQSGSMEIIHNASGSPAYVNLYSPPGLPPGPQLEFSSNEIVFPQQFPGTVDTISVTVFNNGYLNSLNINSVNSTNNYFNILPVIFPVEIEPRSSHEFFITYISADTLQNGLLEFNHNAPGSPSILHVRSAATGAQCVLNVSSLFFTSDPSQRIFWVTNTGVADSLLITNIISTNTHYSVIPNSFPVSVPPGSTKVFEVNLNSTSGSELGTLRVYHNAVNSPDSIIVANYLLTPLTECRIEVVSGLASGNLFFGTHPLANDGLDEIFSESNLPPLPPVGAFDKRLILPRNNFSGTHSSVRDIRSAPEFFMGSKEYRISYQKNMDNGIEIRWYLSDGINGFIQDVINGSFINVYISGTGSFVVQDPVAFNTLKMLINYSENTPVELLSFTASSAGSSVHLNWSTGSETNNNGFELQRRSTNSDWTVVDFLRGKGTSSERNDYTYTDDVAEINTSEVYYRLKQIDFDGRFTYSEEVKVSLIPFKYELYQNYPNPFNPTTKISWQSPVGSHQTIKVYDVLGNEVATLVNEYKEAGSYEVEFDGSSLASGMYIYTLSAGSFTSSKKMLIIK